MLTNSLGLVEHIEYLVCISFVTSTDWTHVLNYKREVRLKSNSFIAPISTYSNSCPDIFHHQNNILFCNLNQNMQIYKTSVLCKHLSVASLGPLDGSSTAGAWTPMLHVCCSSSRPSCNITRKVKYFLYNHAQWVSYFIYIRHCLFACLNATAIYFWD